MTATPTLVGGPVKAPGRPDLRRRSPRWRLPRWAGPVVWVSLLLLVAAILTVISGTGRGEPLDPANPGPDGAQAVARVLQAQGVAVTVVRSQAAFMDASVGPDSTVLVSHTDALSGRTAATAMRHAAPAGRLVLLAPPDLVLRGAGLPLHAVPAGSTGDVVAHCDTADVSHGEAISGGRTAYRPEPGTGGVTVCFPAGTTSAADGYYVTLDRGAGLPTTAVLGSPEVLANRSITDADNAAVALRALGGRGRLLWYVPSVNDISAADDTSAMALLPDALVPGLLLTGSAVLALVLWRGRRLGRLVPEPLPVVVRAIETTQSRGRLYRRARDHERALRVLQLATRGRLAAYLGLGPHADARALSREVAAATGRDPDSVARLLTAPSAHDDASLLDLANQLTALEEEVRRS